MVDNPADLVDLRPKLTPEQITRLEPYGVRETLPEGTVLFDEGDREIDFFVVLSGLIDIRQYTNDGYRSIVKEGPGEFVGDISTLTGRAAVVQAMAEEESEVLRIPLGEAPPGCRRGLGAERPDLADLPDQAFVLDRERPSAIKVIGSRFARDTHRLRVFLTRNNLPFTFLDLEKDPGVAALLEQFGVRPDETPILLHRDKTSTRIRPTKTSLIASGLDVIASDDLCDVVVVGSGPAGLAASVYAASEGSERHGDRHVRARAVRPEPAPRSRTTWAFRPGSPAPTGRTGHGPGSEIRHADGQPRPGRRAGREGCQLPCRLRRRAAPSEAGRS